MANKMANNQDKKDSDEKITEETVTQDVLNNVFTHCPYRQTTLIQQALAPDKMKVAFFIGAGCPTAIRIPDGDGTRPLIPDIAGLTARIRQVIEASDAHKDNFAKLVARMAKAGTKNPNVEEMLSYIRSLGEVVSGGPIDGLKHDDLIKLDNEICKVTTDVVEVSLPVDDSHYHQLAAWIRGIPRSKAAEVFTSNYDLLMEQAFEDRKVPYFDGFVGSRHAFFDLAAIEHDKLPSRWARFWKVHGSINWWRSESGNVERRATPEVGDRQMIYPTHLKYDESRRLPYLAMLDRLKAFLASGQAVLITCGYSFSDRHLNEAILQGLSANPTAICFGLIFGDRATSPIGVKEALKHPNLSLLAADGAVIGSIELDWHSDEKPDHSLHGLAVKAGEMADRTAAPTGCCKFLLGDFGSFSEFLARQLPQGGANEG